MPIVRKKTVNAPPPAKTDLIELKREGNLKLTRQTTIELYSIWWKDTIISEPGKTNAFSRFEEFLEDTELAKQIVANIRKNSEEIKKREADNVAPSYTKRKLKLKPRKPNAQNRETTKTEGSKADTGRPVRKLVFLRRTRRT